MSAESIERNLAGLREQMQRFLDFDAGPNAAMLVNNYDWIGPFSYLEFLRDVGKNFPVNVMLAKDSVKSRLGRDDAGAWRPAGTELHRIQLHAAAGVRLRAFVRRVRLRNPSRRQRSMGQHHRRHRSGAADARRAVVRPHVPAAHQESDGSKMGKTETGTVWLSAARTSPYQFYQYWIRVDDADVGKCLRMLTTLPREEIESLDAARAADAAKRESQRRLAEELTRLVHGAEGLAAAQRATDIFFGAEISDLSDAQLTEIFADVPSEAVAAQHTCQRRWSADHRCARFSRTGEEQRAMPAARSQQGGAYVNNRRIADVNARLTATDLASETVMVLRSGKKNYALLRFDAE